MRKECQPGMRSIQGFGRSQDIGGYKLLRGHKLAKLYRIIIVND